MDKGDGVYFQNMTGRDVEERLEKDDIIIIPVGSTENHGRGQCYGEDTFLVTRMAEIVAHETGCTVSQPIHFGSHPWCQIGHRGTIIIPEEVFVAYLRAVIAGYWNAGFRKQILINGHGQEYIIPNAIQEFAKITQVPSVLCFVNWPTVIAPMLRDKARGGPWETPFRHADEVEASFSMLLFPEMNKKHQMDDSRDPHGFLPPGHIDLGGDIYQYPMPGHGTAMCGPLEVINYPEGVIGKPSLADPKKAEAGLEAIIDYIIKLHNDILAKFPPGKLPDISLVTEQDKENVEALLKGPDKGGKSLYSHRYPI